MMGVRSVRLAQANGSLAGTPAAADLWTWSKRELLEAALRLTNEDDPAEAARIVRTKLAQLKQEGMI